MKEFALCFLAYGDEHIKEFNKVCNKILVSHPLSNIFVLTNDKSKIDNHTINIFEKQEDFNFNLKRYIIFWVIKDMFYINHKYWFTFFIFNCFLT